MSGDIEVKTTNQTIRDLILKNKQSFADVMPKHLNIDRLLKVATGSIIKNGKLLECSQRSLLGAVMEATTLGLEVDGLLGHAWLIPYDGEATLQIGYKGLIELAMRSGKIASFSAAVICENDTYTFTLGLNEELTHTPALSNRGEVIAAYAIARYKDGGYGLDFMNKEELDKVRAASHGSKKHSSPWNKWEEEMYRKTVAKRLTKYLPVSPALQRAASLDDNGSLDYGNHIEVDTTVESPSVLPVIDAKSVVEESEEIDSKEYSSLKLLDLLHMVQQGQLAPINQDVHDTVVSTLGADFIDASPFAIESNGLELLELSKLKIEDISSLYNKIVPFAEENGITRLSRLEAQKDE